MKEDTSAVGHRMRVSSLTVALRCPDALGRCPIASTVARSSAPVISAAPAITYRAAIETGVSEENPDRACSEEITPVTSRPVTPASTTYGAENRSVPSAPTVSTTTARVTHACQPKVPLPRRTPDSGRLAGTHPRTTLRHPALWITAIQAGTTIGTRHSPLRTGPVVAGREERRR